MTVPTPPAVPVPNPPPTPWIVEPSTERVELRGNTAEVTFTVKNQQATQQRAVFEVVPGDAVAASWFAIEGERQRPIEANQSTQYKVTISAPPGTPVASYWFQTRVYAADVAPEESSTLSNRVTFSVPTDTVAPKKPFPWWIIAVVVAVLLVGGVIAFLLTRDGDGGPAVIPGVTGKVSAEAVQELNDAGFDDVQVVRVQSTEIAEGLALGTDPAAGATVETDEPIKLRVAISLDAPTLVAPGDATNFDANTTTSVAMAWNGVPDAANYRVTVVAPACAVTPPTSAPPPTTEPPPAPPTTPAPMFIPDGIVLERSDREIFLDDTVIFQICGFRIGSLVDTTKIDVSATNLDLSVDTDGVPALVQWSVSALDDQGNEGPSSTVRQFSYVP
jgi:hypothetical protein